MIFYGRLLLPLQFIYDVYNEQADQFKAFNTFKICILNLEADQYIHI